MRSTTQGDAIVGHKADVELHDVIFDRALLELQSQLPLIDESVLEVTVTVSPGIGSDVGEALLPLG